MSLPKWSSVDPRDHTTVSYTDEQCLAIEASYRQNPNGSHVLYLPYGVFTIEFSQMRQFNASGGSRKVKRIAPADEVAPQSTTTVESEVARVLGKLTPVLVAAAATAIHRSDSLCAQIEASLPRLVHRFGGRAVGTVRLESLAERANVDGQPVAELLTIAFELMAVGTLSSSGIDFSKTTPSAEGEGDLMRITTGQPVPHYFANVSGESVFRRKCLSVLGLRNLSIHGFSIFSELLEKLFVSDPSQYSNNAGLAKMRYLTGNTVDLDTKVLDCTTQLGAMNKALASEAAAAGRHFSPFSSPSAFFSSAEARAMAVHQAQASLAAFVDLMGLSPTLADARRVVLGPGAEQNVAVAMSHGDRGRWPIWGYSNVGVYTYHSNAPIVPDVIGALLKAPFHLAKAFLMCLQSTGVVTGDLFPQGPDAAMVPTISPASVSITLTATSVGAAIPKLTDFYDRAVNDSCFNAKWKAIESYVDEQTTMGDIDSIIAHLQTKHQRRFTDIYNAGDDDRSREAAELLQIITREETRGRDPTTRTIRRLCKDDITKWIAKTNAVL